MDKTHKKNMHTFRTDDALRLFIERAMQERKLSKTALICNALKQTYALDMFEKRFSHKSQLPKYDNKCRCGSNALAKHCIETAFRFGLLSFLFQHHHNECIAFRAIFHPTI